VTGLVTVISALSPFVLMRWC